MFLFLIIIIVLNAKCFPLLRRKNQKKNQISKEMTTNKELQAILALTSFVPQKEDYIVVASSRNNNNNNNNSNQHQPSSSSSLFAGVRVTRGTLATFGDDTAKQFALHVDKLLKESSSTTTGQNNSKNDNSKGLLVRGGDLSSRAAFLKNGSVKTFEENVSSLLNASLRQREIRQREKENMKHAGTSNDNNNKPANEAARKKNKNDDGSSSSDDESSSSSDSSLGEDDDE